MMSRSDRATGDGMKGERTMRRLASMCVAAGVMTACGGTTTMTGTDSGTGDTDGGTMLPELPTVTTGTLANPSEAPADYSCMASAPMGGDLLPFTFRLLDFADDYEVRSARVQFFPDNVILDECTPPACQELMTDAMGQGMVMAHAGGFYAYRVFARMGSGASPAVVGSVQVNEVAPMEMGGTIEGNSVSQTTINLIPAVLSFRREPGTAVLAGQFFDCAGDEVRGIVIRVFDADGTEMPEGELNTDPHYRYFNGDSMPVDISLQPYSNIDGLYAGVQIPVPTDPTDLYRVEAWGRTEGDAAPRRLGCEATRAFGDTVSITNVGPLRTDYPAGHPCAD